MYNFFQGKIPLKPKIQYLSHHDISVAHNGYLHSDPQCILGFNLKRSSKLDISGRQVFPFDTLISQHQLATKHPPEINQVVSFCSFTSLGVFASFFITLKGVLQLSKCPPYTTLGSEGHVNLKARQTFCSWQYLHLGGFQWQLLCWEKSNFCGEELCHPAMPLVSRMVRIISMQHSSYKPHNGTVIFCDVGDIRERRAILE